MTRPNLPPGRPTRLAHVRRSDSYGNLPLSFEANRGQTDPSVRFLARGDGYGLFLTPTEAVLSLRAPAQRERSAADRSAIRGGASEEPRHTAVVRMRLAGAKERPHITGLDQQPGTSNYFIGKDPERWQRDVPNYARVEYAQVYPGIDHLLRQPAATRIRLRGGSRRGSRRDRAHVRRRTEHCH